MIVKDEITNFVAEFNDHPKDDTRLHMEIRNFMAGVNSSETCYSREVLMSYRLGNTMHLCNQLGGVNFMLRGLNTTGLSERNPNSTLLVTTRMDSLSMFDDLASSSMGVLPGVTVLLSVVNHLWNTPLFKASPFLIYRLPTV